MNVLSTLAMLSFSTACALPPLGSSEEQKVVATKKRPSVMWGIEGVKDLGKKGKCIGIRGERKDKDYVGQRQGNFGRTEQYSRFLDAGDQVVVYHQDSQIYAVLIGNYSASDDRAWDGDEGRYGEGRYWGRNPYRCTLTKDQESELKRLDKLHWENHGNKDERDKKFSCLSEKNAPLCYLGTLDSNEWIVPQRNRYDSTIANARRDNMEMTDVVDKYLYLKGWKPEDYSKALRAAVETQFPVSRKSEFETRTYIEGRLSNPNAYFFDSIASANAQQDVHKRAKESGLPTPGGDSNSGLRLCEWRSCDNSLRQLPYLIMSEFLSGKYMGTLEKGYFSVWDVWEDEYVDKHLDSDSRNYRTLYTALGNFDDLHLASVIATSFKYSRYTTGLTPHVPYMRQNGKAYNLKCINKINRGNLSLDRKITCEKIVAP